MTIGFHYHIPAIQKENGKIYIPGYLGVFLDGLTIYAEKVICFLHSPLESELKLLDYEIKSSNIELVDIGKHDSMMKRALVPYKYTQKIKPFLSSIDVMLIRGPSPLLPPIASLCIKYNKKTSFLIVGDYLEGLNAAVSMNIVKKFILKVYYTYNKFLQDKYMKNSLVFVNNPKIYVEYKDKVYNCQEVKTTTLTKEDFYKRDNTCQNNIINILYTGRIDPTKGIEDMLYAVSILKKDLKVKPILHLVGWETSLGFLDKLQQLVIKLDLKDNFIFHGKKSVGKELFDMYKKSDIYLLASRGDFEGFPRTLWEAMAHSLPIVSTPVGSIGSVLVDRYNAILSDPNCIDCLVSSIKELIIDANLRKIIINNAYSLASTNTIEKQSQYMFEMMERYINEK